MAAISKQLDELLLWLRSERTKTENLQVDALPYSSQLSDSSGFSRPDPKPIYEIKADKEIPKTSSKSKRRYKLQKRISCEELDERTMKGLCVFCGEQETPYHRLQHKNDVILMIDSEDHLSDSMVNKIGNEMSSDRWLSNSIGCELEIGETDNDEDRVPSDSDLVVNDIKKENPEEQALNDEELVETEVATDSTETEHETMNLVPEAQEENPNLENHECWEQIVTLEEESIPQSKVPIANSEILKSIELGKVDLGLEKLEHVVMYENLEQDWDQMNVNEKLEVDGDVERGQKMMSNTEAGCAHKVLVKMPSKEKRSKHLKGWKFKFKPTSKRSRLMDDKFSFVDATVLLNKDPQETIWDCIKKEFKETMAACGKTRVDRFKLVYATPRPGVYDRPLQTRVWDSGGSLLECVDEESFGDDRSREVIAELNSYTGLTHLDKSDFRRFDGDKIKEWLFKVEEFFSIDFTPMELKVKLASNHFEGQLLRQFQELFEKLSLASIMFEHTFSPITEPKKILPSFFRLKHKWRSRLSHSFSEMKQRMIGRVWKSFGYLMEDMMEEDQKQQGDSEPLVIVPDFDAKVCVTFDQCIRKRLFVSADRGTKNNKPTLRVLMDKKPFHLSLRNHRVWDPGG